MPDLPPVTGSPVAQLTAAIVVLSVLVAAGPTVVGLASLLPPLVLAFALAAALLRLVWFITSRRSRERL